VGRVNSTAAMSTERPSPPQPAEPAWEADPLHRDFVMSLEKGLAVIAAFDQHRPRLTIAEVAARCEITRAAARRYLLTLEHLGYVNCDRKMYALTAKVLRLGQSYMHSARLPRIIQPVLLELATKLQEASSAGVLDGDDVISIAATTSGRPVSVTLQPGTRVPAHCTANGRILLGVLSPLDFERWLARQALEALTPHTITSTKRLADEIARARAVGYALVDQELEVGLRTIAVPLKNHRGEVIASINVSAHAGRMSMDRLVDECLPALLDAQTRLRSVL
jgi:IclR family pca regulon transcriptional regulator